MDSDTVYLAVSELEEKFREKPLQFTVESALVDELVRILRNNVEEPVVSVEGKYEREEDDAPDEFNYTNYKEPYLCNMGKSQKISRVLPEVNIGDRGENKRLDIAVLRDSEEPIEVEIKKGTKYFHKKDIEHAIEVKYVKNDNIIASKNEEDEKEIFPHTQGDLSKLRKNMSDADSRWMIIASNKDIFKKEEDLPKEAKARDREDDLKNYCRKKPKIEFCELHLKMCGHEHN